MSDQKIDAEYTGTPLHGDRQPENRAVAVLDARGNVIALQLLKPGEAGAEFWIAIQEMRDLYPIDPADIVMGNWPVDEEGRGLSVLEVMRQQPNKAAA